MDTALAVLPPMREKLAVHLFDYPVAPLQFAGVLPDQSRRQLLQYRLYGSRDTDRAVGRGLEFSPAARRPERGRVSAPPARGDDIHFYGGDPAAVEHLSRQDFLNSAAFCHMTYRWQVSFLYLENSKVAYSSG
jgi:hypothetical protein